MFGTELKQIIGGVVAVIVLTGCSSTARSTDSPDSTADSPPGVSVAAATFDPATLRVCDVLAKAEVEAAFGETVTVDDATTGECWWETKTTLKRMVFKRDSAPDTPEALAERRRGFDNSSWEKIDLGTDGFRGKVVPSVDWLIGAHQFELNVAWSTKGDPYPIAEKLARLVDSRIVHPS